MILPIVAYGDPVLRKVAEDIDKDYQGLDELIDNMYQSMYAAKGVGLAAPQIGRSIRLFVIDSEPMMDPEDEGTGIKEVFINAQILEEQGYEFDFEEGCLSIPGIREDVRRPETVKIEYYDRKWNMHVKTFEGMTARVIQHEYDHIEGILFTDHVKPLRKQFLKRKLEKIRRGDVKTDYRMEFARKGKR
jgi:peptide deformylase